MRSPPERKRQSPVSAGLGGVQGPFWVAVAPKKNKRNIDPWSPAGPPPELQLGRIFYGGVIESPKTCPYPRGLGVGAPQIKAEGLKEVGTPNLGGLRGWDPNPGSLLEVRAPKPWELWGVGPPNPASFNIRGVDAGFAGPVRSLRSPPEPKRQSPVSAGQEAVWPELFGTTKWLTCWS